MSRKEEGISKGNLEKEELNLDTEERGGKGK